VSGQHASAEEQIADLRRLLEEALRENAGLREENARLRKEIEEWKRGHRERSKRRSSRPERAPKGERKRPGRKAGHPGARRPVPKADRQVVHPVPARCACGGCVEKTGETLRTVVQDVPPVRVENVEHVAHVGRCKKCGRSVSEPLPGAVKSGQSIAQVQLGPNAQALIVGLRYDHRMPLRGIASVLGTWFGLEISAGGICQLIDRLRARSVASYEEIEARIRASGLVGLDETGLRQDGVSGWAWLARTDEASLFRVELSRGSWVAERMLGSNFLGVVCSDFYGVYTARDDWSHAYCGGHLVREVKKIAEVAPNLWTTGFRDELCDWYVDAKHAQQHGTRAERRRLRSELDILATKRRWWEDPEVIRVCHRIDEHFEGIVAFLDNPSIPADNNATERDIRPFAVYRKVTGGTRSANGSLSLAHWMSVTQTLRKNGLPLRDYVAGLHSAHLHGRAPPSVFAPD
jgi:transposase